MCFGEVGNNSSRTVKFRSYKFQRFVANIRFLEMRNEICMRKISRKSVSFFNFYTFSCKLLKFL